MKRSSVWLFRGASVVAVSVLAVVSSVLFFGRSEEAPPRYREVAAQLPSIVRSTGEDCAAATGTFFQGADGEGNQVWNVACSNGEAFVVLRSQNGRGPTRVLSCDVRKASGWMECFQLPGVQ